MSLTIPDDLLAAAHISEDEALQELAIALFQQERLTLGQAARFAKISVDSFMQVLASRKISLHYGVADFEQDLETLRKLDQK
jgi:predicted HTH domain antitoxin